MSRSQVMNESKKKDIEDKDEFYTLFQDISDELGMYKEQLKGKRIICPCDWDESYETTLVYKEEGFVSSDNLFFDGGTIKRIDIENSKDKVEKDLSLVKCNFIKYLVSHGEDLGIKSVSVSGYNPKTLQGIRFQDIDYSNYDLVITNPPFSQFREFIETMFKFKVKFLIIGPTNSLSYKNVFTHFQKNEMWLGYHHHMTGFIRPDGTVLPKNHSIPRWCCWVTNLDVNYRHDKLILTEEYSETKYPKYCNYDGIDVKSVEEIPYDFYGNMGVPITFLQKYNPEQFEILGTSRTLGEFIPSDVPNSLKGGMRFYLKDEEGNYKRLFEKMVIRRRDKKNDY